MHATHQVRNRGTLSFQVRPRLRPTFCASPRRQNALGHTRTILCENSQVKCRRPRRFLQACAVVSQEPFYARILRLKCHKPRPRPTLSASLRSRMHMDSSQEQFHARIYRKKNGKQMEHPDQAAALALAVRTPQCGHTVLGKMEALMAK